MIHNSDAENLKVYWNPSWSTSTKVSQRITNPLRTLTHPASDKNTSRIWDVIPLLLANFSVREKKWFKSDPVTEMRLKSLIDVAFAIFCICYQACTVQPAYLGIEED